MMPRVSIVLPVFNGEELIRNSIASVLSQTFNDFELIIINDGSTDKTPDIIREFDDDRIKTFSYANSGLSKSRNRGVSKSRGEYIAFLDHDDVWMPDKLEQQLYRFQAEDKPDIVYGQTQLIDRKGNPTTFSRFGRSFAGGESVFEGNILEYVLRNNFIWTGSNIMVKRGVFEVVGKYDEDLRSCEDWDMNIRMANLFKFGVVKKKLLLQRIYSGQMSSNFSIMTKEKCVVFVRHCKTSSLNWIEKAKCWFFFSVNLLGDVISPVHRDLNILRRFLVVFKNYSSSVRRCFVRVDVKG